MGGLSGMPKMPELAMPSLNMKMPELKMPGMEMSQMKLPDMVIHVLVCMWVCVNSLSFLPARVGWHQVCALLDCLSVDS
jgi:hypothetical protein